ncbi:MAG: hypothetical protein HRT88_23655, partial [Lentisphaeraceae bacterium]|nr:hypothetical protein [Lentisphaeraceae bacterium]
GDIDKALADIDKELLKGKYVVLLNEQKLKFYKRQKEWDLAIKTLADLSKLSSVKKTAKMKELVELCLRAGKPTEALQWIAEWKKASPGSTSPYLQEASILHSEDKSEEALAVLKKAMFKFADNETIPRTLAQQLMLSGDFKGAEGIYWRLISKNEDLSVKLGVVKSIIQLAQQQDLLEELKHKLQSRMKNNPKSIFPPLALAELSRSTNSYEDRRQYLIKATQIKTNDLSLLKEIARIEEEEGQYERALESIKKIEKLDTKKKYSGLLAQFYMRSGEEDLAFDLLREESGEQDMKADGVVSSAISLIKSKSSRSADFIKPFLLKFPLDYRIAFLYGIALEENSEDELAAEVFISVLEAKEEVNKKATPAAATTVHPFTLRHQKMMLKFMPQEAIELMQVKHHSYTVYSYKNNNTRHYSSFGVPQKPSFPMPQNLGEIESYVLVHLSAIVARLEDEDKTSIIQKLERSGVDYADIKLFQRKQQQHNVSILEDWQEFVKKYKGDKAVKSLYIYMISHRLSNQQEFDDNFETVKNTHPLLAMTALAGAIQRKFDIK